MPIANYSTTVDALKTVGEIQGILVAHGAKSILMNYGKDGSIESLSFIVETPHGDMSIRLPIDAKAGPGLRAEVFQGQGDLGFRRGHPMSTGQLSSNTGKAEVRRTGIH